MSITAIAQTFRTKKRERAFRRTDGHCFYCGCDLAADNEYVPLEEGGYTEPPGKKFMQRAYDERQDAIEQMSEDARRRAGAILDPYLSIARANQPRLEAATSTLTLLADLGAALGDDERAINAIRRGIERARTL